MLPALIDLVSFRPKPAGSEIHKSLKLFPHCLHLFVVLKFWHLIDVLGALLPLKQAATMTNCHVPIGTYIGASRVVCRANMDKLFGHGVTVVA